MKKKLTLLIGLLLMNYTYSQVGINTETPQETLHVNGTLQLTNELNVGGDSSNKGKSGVNGQFLISQGAGLAPKWATVNIPVLNSDSYKLNGVYSFDLLDPFTNTNNNFLALGKFNNIKVDSPTNFIVVEFQSSASVISLSTGEGMSYRYRLSGNNNITSVLSPFFYVNYGLFNPINNITSYRFFLTNITPNTYNLNLEAMRSNTVGTATAAKYIHFNRTYSTSSSFIRDGKAIVYVYEK